MKRPYITYVSTNLKRGGEAHLEPGLNLILGPNGAGKSTRTQAVELALSGGVSHVSLGRWGFSRDAKLISASLASGRTVTAEVNWSDGEVSTYTSKGKASERQRGPGGLFLADFWAEVTGSTERGTSYLVDRLVADLTEEDVAALVGDIDLPGAGSWVARIQAARDAAKKGVLEAQQDRRTSQRILNEVASHAGAPVRQSQVEAARQRMHEIENQRAVERTATPVTEQVIRSVFELRDQIVEHENTLNCGYERKRTLEAKLQQAELDLRQHTASSKQELSAASARIQRVISMRDILVSLREESAVAEDTCPVCASTGRAGPLNALASWTPPASATDRINAARQRADDLVRLRDTIQRTYRSHLADLSRYEGRLDVLQQRMESLRADYPVDGILEGDVQAEPVDEVDTEAAMREHREAVRAFGDLSKRYQEQQRVARYRSDLEEAEAAEATCKLRVKTLDRALSTLVDSALEDFSASVTAALPDAYGTFRLSLKPLMFGLERAGNVEWSLSGSEEVTVVCAMASVLARPGERAVVIPPDRDWDPASLADALRSLSTLTGGPQVILTTTTKPKGRISRKVNVVRLEAAEEPEVESTPLYVPPDAKPPQPIQLPPSKRPEWSRGLGSEDQLVVLPRRAGQTLHEALEEAFSDFAELDGPGPDAWRPEEAWRDEAANRTWIRAQNGGVLRFDASVLVVYCPPSTASRAHLGGM